MKDINETWLSKPNIHPIPKDIPDPSGLSANDFVSWCIIHVLNKPERLNTLEHFKQSLNHYKIPYAYMWKRLKQDWGSEIHDYFASKLKDAEEPYGTSWKNKEESNG